MTSGQRVSAKSAASRRLSPAPLTAFNSGPNKLQVEEDMHGVADEENPVKTTEKRLLPLGWGPPAATAASIANRRSRCRWGKKNH